MFLVAKSICESSLTFYDIILLDMDFVLLAIYFERG